MNEEGALALSYNDLNSSYVHVHQHVHYDGPLSPSNDALLPSHDNALAPSDAEVGQGCTDNGDLELSGDTPDNGPICSHFHSHIVIP